MVGTDRLQKIRYSLEEEAEKGTNHPTGTICRLISMLENKTLETLPFIKKIIN